MMKDKLIALLPSNNRLELIWKLAQVDFQARYYNDRLGLLWALIKPLFEVTLYFIVFTQFFEVKEENYGLYLFGGIIMWSVFAESTARGMSLLQSKLYLIDNIQFNHFDIFISNIFSILFSFVFNFIAFMLIVLFIGTSLTFHPLVLCLSMISLFTLALGLTLILATVQPFFRDLAHLWDMIILSGFWTSGILYDANRIFTNVEWFSYFNPLVGIIWNGRASILGNLAIKYDLLAINFISSILILCVGALIFKRFGSAAIEKL